MLTPNEARALPVGTKVVIFITGMLRNYLAEVVETPEGVFHPPPWLKSAAMGDTILKGEDFGILRVATVSDIQHTGENGVILKVEA